MMKYFVTALAGLLVTVHTAAAIMLTAGTQELKLEGFVEEDSALGSQVDLSTGYGYFVADYFEVGGGISFDSSDASSSFGLKMFTEYNIDTLTSLIPVAGVSLGYVNFNDDRSNEDGSGLELGVYGGGKLFITDYLALSAILNLGIGSENIYAGEKEPEATKVELKFGLRVFF